ncbi:hypothetical protein ACYX79_10725 [Stenotrophomonas rhizophila]
MDTNLNNPYAAVIHMERAKIAQYEARILECRARIEALEGLSIRAPDDVDIAIERQLREKGIAEASAHSGIVLPPLPPLPAIGNLGQAVGESAPVVPTPRDHVQTSVSVPTIIPPAPINPSIQNLQPSAGVSAVAPGLTMPSGIPPLPAAHAEGSESEYSDPKREVSAQAIELLRFLSHPATSDEVFDYAEGRQMRMNRAAVSTFLYTYRTKYGFIQALEAGKYQLNTRGHLYAFAPSRLSVKFEAPDAVAAAPGDGQTQVEHLTRTEGTDRTGGY